MELRLLSMGDDTLTDCGQKSSEKESLSAFLHSSRTAPLPQSRELFVDLVPDR